MTRRTVGILAAGFAVAAIIAWIATGVGESRRGKAGADFPAVRWVKAGGSLYIETGSVMQVADDQFRVWTADEMAESVDETLDRVYGPDTAGAAVRLTIPFEMEVNCRMIAWRLPGSRDPWERMAPGADRNLRALCDSARVYAR